MADTNYRQPRSLEDLLAMSGDPTVPPPSAPTATGTATSPDTFTDPRERRLFEMLTKPQDQGAAPTVEKKSTAGSIFKVIGDAISTYASIMGRNPNLETHSFQKYLANLERQKAELQQYTERTAKADQEAKLRGAEFLFTAGERKQMRQQDQQDKLDLQKNLLDQRKADAAQRAAEEQAQRAARQQEFDAKKAWDLEMEKARFSHETIVAGIRKKAGEGDEIAKEDKKALGPILGTISALTMTAKQNLADGKTTPEELNGLVGQMMDAAMLSPDARKAAEAHFNLKLGDILREYHLEQMKKQPVNGPENQAQPGILEQLGSVPTPQRY